MLLVVDLSQQVAPRKRLFSMGWILSHMLRFWLLCNWGLQFRAGSALIGSTRFRKLFSRPDILFPMFGLGLELLGPGPVCAILEFHDGAEIGSRFSLHGSIFCHLETHLSTQKRKKFLRIRMYILIQPISAIKHNNIPPWCNNSPTSLIPWALVWVWIWSIEHLRGCLLLFFWPNFSVF